MNTNRFIQLLLILFITNCYSQNLKVEILLKNGETKIGEVSKKINFEKDVLLIENNNKTPINLEDINTLTLFSENGKSVYESVKCYYRKKIEKKPKLLKVVIKGYLSLYYFNYDVNLGPNFPASGGKPQGINNTFIYGLREGEEAATLLSDIMQGQVNPNAYFKYIGPKYFSDYPELAKKIEDKVYTYLNIFQVAIEYNNWKKKGL